MKRLTKWAIRTIAEGLDVATQAMSHQAIAARNQHFKEVADKCVAKAAEYEMLSRKIKEGLKPSRGRKPPAQSRRSRGRKR